MAKKPEKSEPKKLLVRISPALHTRLKVLAAKTGESMQSLVEEAISDLLSKRK